MTGFASNAMPLRSLQRRAARIVLGLPEAEGFALAGGAALVVHEIVDRGTKDLDCFGPSTVAVNELVEPASRALAAAGLNVTVLVHADGFAKLLVTKGRERTQIDLGFDPASLPPKATDLGPVRALEDLAGDKLLALFGRAASRDFIDVAALLRRFTADELCGFAASKDAGFSLDVLADAFGVLPRYDREDEFPNLTDDEYADLLALFADWRQRLIER
jgi:Nucleotidyl transferase AbiEii toxin, Type IV TA system